MDSIALGNLALYREGVLSDLACFFFLEGCACFIEYYNEAAKNRHRRKWQDALMLNVKLWRATGELAIRINSRKPNRLPEKRQILLRDIAVHSHSEGAWGATQDYIDVFFGELVAVRRKLDGVGDCSLQVVFLKAASRGEHELLELGFLVTPLGRCLTQQVGEAIVTLVEISAVEQEQGGRIALGPRTKRSDSSPRDALRYMRASSY